MKSLTFEQELRKKCIEIVIPIADTIYDYILNGSCSEYRKDSKTKPNIWKDSILLKGYYTHSEALNACPNGYRIPTKEEFEELVERTKYSFDKKTKEGMFTFPDGFELRLPADGYRYGSDGTLYYVFSGGNYWSSTQYDSDYTYGLYLYRSDTEMNYSYHSSGLSVLCIKETNNP